LREKEGELENARAEVERLRGQLQQREQRILELEGDNVEPAKKVQAL